MSLSGVLSMKVRGLKLVHEVHSTKLSISEDPPLRRSRLGAKLEDVSFPPLCVDVDVDVDVDLDVDVDVDVDVDIEVYLDYDVDIEFDVDAGVVCGVHVHLDVEQGREGHMALSYIIEGAHEPQGNVP